MMKENIDQVNGVIQMPRTPEAATNSQISVWLLSLTFVEKVIGLSRDEKVLPFKHRKRQHCLK